MWTDRNPVMTRGGDPWYTLDLGNVGHVDAWVVNGVWWMKYGRSGDDDAVRLGREYNPDRDTGLTVDAALAKAGVRVVRDLKRALSKTGATRTR